MLSRILEKKGKEGEEGKKLILTREIYHMGQAERHTTIPRRTPDQEKANHDSMTTLGQGISHSRASQSLVFNYREAVADCGSGVASGLLGFCKRLR